MKTKEELQNDLNLAKKKLKDLPLDCSDRQWERRTQVVKSLEKDLEDLNK